jgi:hypothetical protein
VGKSLFRYAPKALPHEILNNCIAIHWPTFAPPRWPTFTPALTQAKFKRHVETRRRKRRVSV